MKTKRGVTTEETVVGIVILLIVAVVLFMWWYNTQETIRGTTNTQVVRQWVDIKSGFLQTTKGKIDTLPDRPPVAELYPPLEISSRDQLKCSGEDGEKVCREIANAMVECWEGAFASGKKDFLSQMRQENLKNFCFNCRTIRIADNVKKGDNHFIGFNAFLEKNRPRNDKNTYLEIITNNNAETLTTKKEKGELPDAYDKIKVKNDLFITFYATNDKTLKDTLGQIQGVANDLSEKVQNELVFEAIAFIIPGSGLFRAALKTGALVSAADTAQAMTKRIGDFWSEVTEDSNFIATVVIGGPQEINTLCNGNPYDITIDAEMLTIESPRPNYNNGYVTLPHDIVIKTQFTGEGVTAYEWEITSQGKTEWFQIYSDSFMVPVRASEGKITEYTIIARALGKNNMLRAETVPLKISVLPLKPLTTIRIKEGTSPKNINFEKFISQAKEMNILNINQEYTFYLSMTTATKKDTDLTQGVYEGKYKIVWELYKDMLLYHTYKDNRNPLTETITEMGDTLLVKATIIDMETQETIAEETKKVHLAQQKTPESYFYIRDDYVVSIITFDKDTNDITEMLKEHVIHADGSIGGIKGLEGFSGIFFKVGNLKTEEDKQTIDIEVYTVTEEILTLKSETLNKGESIDIDTESGEKIYITFHEHSSENLGTYSITARK